VHQRDITERVGSPFGEIRVISLDNALKGFGLAQHQRSKRRKHDAEDDKQYCHSPVEEERQRDE
jgi:hypothetical protein